MSAHYSKLIPVLALLLAACAGGNSSKPASDGSGSYSDLVIKPETGNRQSLAAVRLLKRDSRSRLSRLSTHDKLYVDRKGYLTVYVDLRHSKGEDDIRLYDEIQRGLRARIKVVDPATWRVLGSRELPRVRIKGYRLKSVIITRYDERGRRITRNRVRRGTKIPYGTAKYTNTSLVRTDIKLYSGWGRRVQNALVFLELDYSKYKSPETLAQENRLNGNDLVQRMRKDPGKEVVVTLRQGVDYRALFGSTPRRTRPIPVKLVKSYRRSYRRYENQDIRIYETAGGIRIRAMNIRFAPNRWQLPDKDSPVLARVVEILKKFPNYRIIVEGHSDKQGRARYNLYLSTRRAQSVMEYLIHHGISEHRLSTRGRGSAKPIASNRTARGRAQNRRVEFILIKYLDPELEPDKSWDGK